MNLLKDELNNIFNDLKWEEKNTNEIYLFAKETIFEQLIEFLASQKLILVNLFAAENFKDYSDLSLFYVFEKRASATFLIVILNVSNLAKSIAKNFPNALWYEREITDGFGLEFEESFDKRKLFLHEIYHEDFHPLRKSFVNQPIDFNEKINPKDEYQFKKVHGEGIYQIPVGPVHAGIIEPGHFRFSVIGETIFNLEIRMFWKHRGIEKLAEGKTPEEALRLAESISGDETIANALAYVETIEKVSQISVPERAVYLRTLLAEMERIYALLGDLAGIILDAAYPAGASNFFILREEILRWNEKLTESRFLKNIIKISGLNIDLSEKVLHELLNYFKNFMIRFNVAFKQSVTNSSVLDRLETTGIIKEELVNLLNLSGPLARAAGTQTDVRTDHPYGLYKKLKPKLLASKKGDVLARFNIKIATIKDAVTIIKKIINELPKGMINTPYSINDGFAMSAVESARGQNLNFIYIEHGKISRYKIRTASFCNWLAIEKAVLGNIVPDFPLINKSLNLSYAGTDL